MGYRPRGRYQKSKDGRVRRKTFVVQFSVTNEEEVGANNAQGPPVPIPNTEVKLRSAEDTRLETAWEKRTAPTPREGDSRESRAGV